MGELVEDRSQQPRLAPEKHRVEDGVGQVAEGRIGRHTTHADVAALRREAAGPRMRVVGVEEAEVCDAAGDGKAPAPRLDGEFRCGDYTPDRVRATEVCIAPVALTIRQAQLAHRELACFDHQGEPRARALRRRRIGCGGVDRTAAREHIELSACRLHQVTAAERQADRKDC